MKRFTGLWLFAALLALLPLAAAAVDIATAQELYEYCSGAEINEDVNLTGEVYDMSPYSTGANSWQPIICMNGVFNGNGAVIKGLNMSRYNRSVAGISGNCHGFISINNGTVEDLNIELDTDAEVKQYFGAVAAYNTGDILNCRVYGSAEEGVTIKATASNSCAGGIAGWNEGVIADCSVSGISIVTTALYCCAGGIAGRHVGQIGETALQNCAVNNVSVEIRNYDSSWCGAIAGSIESSAFSGGYFLPAEVDLCTATNCSLTSTKGGFVGGIAGSAQGCVVTDCRINYVDIVHSGNYYCAIGGLFGQFTDTADEPAACESCYWAGAVSRGMQYGSTSEAGGIVGTYDASDGEVKFSNCFFCTDFTDVTELYCTSGGNAADTNFAGCAGVAKSAMTAEGWAADNLGEGWTNYGPEGYPLWTDRVPVSFARLHRGGDYLPATDYRLYYDGEDVAAMGLADPAAEFDPDLFYIVGPDEGGLDLEVEYVTLNGQEMTETVTAGDFDTLTFSAVVDNCASKYGVIPTIEEANRIYRESARYYSAASRAELKAAIDDAQEELDDRYLFMTWDDADRLILSLLSIEHDKFLYTVIFDNENSSIYYWFEPDEDWFETDGEYRIFGDELSLKAVPDEGYRFLYWADSAGNKLSEDAEFTYTVNRTTTLTAVVAPENSYDFIYKDTYGKIYKIQPVTDYSEVAYPAEVGSTGLRTGYAVSGWTNDYEGGLPASGEVTGNVTFTASLTKTSTTYRVTSNVAGEEETANLKLAALFTRTAPDEYEGSAFSCWKDSDSGCVLSYNAELKVSVYSDMNVEAVYGEAANSVTLAILQTPIVSSGKIAFTGQVVEGDDFASEIMHGVLLLRSDAPVTDLVIDTPGVIVGKSSGYSAVSKTFIINKKNVADGDVWYGRAFVVYRDTNGVEKIAYSDIKSATM
ncbi:MAG: hypothetical protein IK083_08995 [Abditibacteriota bacterium]|nr:hypothetical protein [Abditibacteriota bacterium]